MSQPVLLKVYGNIYPANTDLATALRKICRDAQPGDEEIIREDGDLLRISFEGIYFPVEDVLELLAKELTPMQKGKLDVLDIENWAMDRHVLDQGKIHSSHAPLNNVLDYSGH